MSDKETYLKYCYKGRVLVKPSGKTKKGDGAISNVTETESGLFVPIDEQAQDVEWGEVINYGEEVEETNIGDIVYYLTMAGRKILINNEIYLVMSEKDLLLKDY